MRHDADWWVVDKVDDRGQPQNDIAKFSDFGLAERFLTWRWSSVTRSAIGAKQLGVQLQSLGMASGVDVFPIEREGAVELCTSAGSAVVPRSVATIFSHVMSKSVEELEQMVRKGLT
ncbi:hypothetical protein A5650_04755 [Mycobacterium sp. 1164985.4]|nr:hypothetical protein A5650_04755 [Mycobacterium sp. 1164985.4]